jgi:hypothetical protein
MGWRSLSGIAKPVTLLETPSRTKADCASVMPAPTYLYCETDSAASQDYPADQDQVFQPPILAEFRPLSGS